MKTTAIHLSLSFLAVTGLNAQHPGNWQGPRPPHMPPLIAALDADHDGVISADEIANAPTALATLDKNNDGQLTHNELRQPRPDGQGPPDGAGPQGPPPGAGPQGPPPMVAALDSDEDGTISAGEIKAASESLKTLDKNNDGELSREEFAPHGPGGPRGGRGPRGPYPDGPPPMPEDGPAPEME